MKSWTSLRILILSLILSACSRNPLGEDLKQPILNLAVVLSQSCSNTLNQDSLYSCQVNTSETIVGLTWSLNPSSTCAWATINSTTGLITGTPNDNQVGNCNLVVDAATTKSTASPLTVAVQVNNLAPILTIANPISHLLEGDPATIIRADATVQASEEGFGVYSLDLANTSAPRCFDNAATLSIDSTTGAVTFQPAAFYNGTCFIRVAFDDQNASVNSVVASEFSVVIDPVNSPPVIAPIATQNTNENTPLVLNLTVTDPDNVFNCAVGLSATSSNTILIPDANIVFSGTTPNCTATITPTSSSTGSSTITLTATDGLLTGNNSFLLNVIAVNDAPVMSAIANQSFNEDSSVVVNFTINDIDSLLSCSGLNLSATSSNGALLPVANIVFGGTAPNCTATLTSVADANGSANISFIVNDLGVPNLIDTQSFSVTVNPVNDPPVISALTSVTTNEDTDVIVNFTITDVDNSLTCATAMSATSSNSALIANIAFSGTAPNCIATITPSLNETGSTNIGFNVTDGTAAVGTFFSLTVTAVNDAPVISVISNQVVSEDNSIAVNFTISDVDDTLNCATSLSATSTNTTLLPIASIVFSGTAPNCSATLTPGSSLNGVSNLSFIVTDGVLTNASLFVLTVTGINNAPVISAISNQVVSEDNSVAVNFTISDIDNTLDCTTSVSAISTNTTLLPITNIVFSGTAPNCSATLSPAADQNGTTNLSFTVSDGSLTDVKNFTFTVNAVNDAPVISSVANQTLNEDNSVAVNFTISDVDNTLDCTTSVSATSTNSTLLPIVNIVFSGTAPNCTATLSPAADQNGVSNLSLIVTDGLTSDTTAFSLTVLGVNDAPVLSALSATSTNEDNAVVINFTITDIDSTLLCTSLNLGVTSSNSTLLPSANVVWSGTAPNCSATLTPASDQNGISNLTVTVSDNGSPNLQDAQTFALTVNAVNDAPVLAAISNQTTNEDIAQVVNLTVTDIDSTLNCSTSLSASSSNTTLVPVANIVFSGTAPNCLATITPAANLNGVLNLTLRVSDGSLFQDQTFQLTVNAVDDAPVISAISNQTTNEGTLLTINYTITDIDSTLNCNTSMNSTSTNSALIPTSAIVMSGTAPNCVATVTPVALLSGSTNVGFIVSDGTTSVTQSFSITVLAVNDPPVMSSLVDVSTNESTSVNVNFTITDPDNSLSCATSVSATSSNSTLIPVANIVFSGTAPNCTATLSPVIYENGISNISFIVTDGTLTDTKSFVLTVIAVNNPPVISDLFDDLINEDSSYVANFTISDPDNTLNCTTSMSATSTDLALIPVSQIVFSGTAPNCTVTITPVANGFGASDINITVSDGVLQDSTQFNLTVSAVNDNPTIAAITAKSTAEDTPLVFNFTINDVDNTLTCNGSVLVTSSNATLLPATTSFVFSGTVPNCTVTVTPALNRFGSSNVNFFVTDGVAVASRSFTVTVTSVNDAPVISAISATTTNELSAVVIPFTISDVETAIACNSTYLSMTSSNTTLIPTANVSWSGTAPNCSATVTPNGYNNGTSNLAFVVTDTSLTATSSFVLTVNPVNQTPTITAISNTVAYEGRPTTISFTLDDIDGSLTCSATHLSASSLNATLIPISNIVFGGTYPNCTATLSIANGQAGTSNISITVSDTVAMSSSAFTLTGYNITSVALSPLTPIVPKLSNVAFTFTATYSDSTTRNITTNSTWATSNSAISSFPSSGVLNNTYSGTTTATTTVTATYGAFSANTLATINPATITSIYVNPASANMNIGNTLQLGCYGITSDNGVVDLTQSCSWATANATIATVDNSLDKGLVTAVNLGSATNITATYSSFSANSAITVDVNPPVQSDLGTGLTARYYTGGAPYLVNLVNTRIDATVNYNWAAGNNPAGSADAFSVRWTGFVKPTTTGTYTFYTQSDDGVRMWVNGTQIINNWTNHGSVENSGTISLTAGTKYSITLEFFENSGSAVIQLRYSASGVAKQIIPQSQLYP